MGEQAWAFVPDGRLVELAERVGEALGLHLHGVDVLVGPTNLWCGRQRAAGLPARAPVASGP